MTLGAAMPRDRILAAGAAAAGVTGIAAMAGRYARGSRADRAWPAHYARLLGGRLADLDAVVISHLHADQVGVQEQDRAAPPEADGAGSAGGSTPLDGLARWAMRVPWLWPALLTLLVGGYQIDRPELWRDELWSWSFAADPVRQLVSSAGGSNPAEVAYDLLLHYWMAAFDDSILAMRMLSVLAMAGAAACVTQAGRRLAGPRAGLLGGLVFALVPSVSRFGQEVRFYAPVMLAVSLATLLLLRALDAPSVRW
jgi:hypothetical protein